MIKRKNILKIAIDSPAAAGAGTLAKHLSKHYNLFYLDTGKIYRFIAYLKLKFPRKFNNKFIKKFNVEPNKVSILAYDALGLIYYCWYNNNFQFRKAQLYNKNGFKGLHGKFLIEGNLSKQKLKIYKISEKKFIEVY